ncbi:unnamed protein product [Rotaria sp. Silwood1]|nr:unnamed protein product [Rotaria sp. Silwood1]CAF1061396.1 unnamed protein product [Rotaria sp. Silwood1]CAF1106153.1 unnamed protein product [Rotaria sp. Silwood1]CAF3404664.1 unnamed protein product [Rotaria sp. Silwood1]CAF3417600.1 unnamed protein product [Rotaria sp. Silwood1]
MMGNDELKVLDNFHKDFIHDTAFNFYGTRMATCSSDGYVRIYDLHDDTWRPSGSFSLPLQTGPMIRVTWAHPEFGGILATVAYDRFVNVWYETPTGPNDPSEYATKWVNRDQFLDSFLFGSSEQRSSSADTGSHSSAYNTVAIQFAPKHLGLILATVFFDGRVRIYDFQGPNVVNKEEIQTKMSNLSCISWSTARHHLAPLIAVGSDDCNTGTGAKLQLWEYAPDRKAVKVDLTTVNMLLQNAIKDIQFAPNFGQSYHLLAVASNDIDLFTIKPAKGELNNSSENKAQTYDVTRIITLDDHGSTVWKVCWNVFGSVLYSCGDDARIRMWKGTINGPWKCETNISLQAEALEKAKANASQSTEPVST